MIAAIIALALASTALAYVNFFRLMATIGAVNVALVTLLGPVSAILLGILVLGEPPGLSHAAGMALIAPGQVAINGRPVNLRSRR